MKDIAEQFAGALERYETYVNPSLTRLMRFLGLDAIEASGQGAIVRDHTGREYIDCASGYGVFFLGHRHPRIINAVKQQLDMMPMSTRMLISHPPGVAAQLLAEVTPGDLQYTFFSNSGAESVEAAIKFARVATGRTEIIATEGAYHGKTMGALSASGRDQYKTPFMPLVPGFRHVRFGDPEVLREAVTENTAAVILEPIQGENGVMVPADDYLRVARQVCDQTGALLILDEVQTGLGRTGKMFACEHVGIAPDIMCMAKALGGGVLPIGATTGTAKVWEFFEEHPLLHTSTFGGNPIGCAAAAETIRVIREERLVEAAQEKGARCLARFADLAEQYPKVISAVRGRGLLIGLEFSSEGAGGVVMSELVGRGVLAVYTLNNQRVIRWCPPAVIEDVQLDTAMAALADSVAEAALIVDQL